MTASDETRAEHEAQLHALWRLAAGGYGGSRERFVNLVERWQAHDKVCEAVQAFLAGG